MPRLCINLDHVATLREARRHADPDLISAAVLARMAGADALSVHLRGDRRHVQEADVERLRDNGGLPLRLRLANSSEVVHHATTFKPDLVTILPERRDEVTTESGVDVLLDQHSLQRAVRSLHEAGLRVGLFIEPDLEQVRAVAKSEADVVEVNAFHYGMARGDEPREQELERLSAAVKAGVKMGLEVHVGHGIGYAAAEGLGTLAGLKEVQVGHAVVARALLTGFQEAVAEMRRRLAGR
ncbi:MAG: pyridoxine 5'-phosphate synthase [Acidobacteriota bacterium]|jgi:pyridoxine 5-phosphate synthase